MKLSDRSQKVLHSHSIPTSQKDESLCDIKLIIVVFDISMSSPDKAIFEKRFKRHFDELKWLFCELYGDNRQAFNDFCRGIFKYYSERKPELIQLDLEREKNPKWYKQQDKLGMQMYVNAFAGTLKGVESKLDYITSCNVNYLHLMPLLESPPGKSDGGYAVADFRKVQPELGTMDDLEHLADKCRERGISVCLDFVMNHTSDEHEWAKKARQGDPEYVNRYYIYDSFHIPAKFEQTVPEVFPTTAPGNFSWIPEIQKFVMTTFYPYQWDLNYGNPVVFSEMVYNMLNLTNKGIDVIRIDAVPYIWKILGTKCRNLQQVHVIVRIMRMVCEIVCPSVILLGEVVMEPSKVVPYFGSVEKPECHMLYNVTTMASTWSTVATRDVRLLRCQMDIINNLPKDYTFLNYLRCHDDIGWGLDYNFLRQFGTEEIPHKKFINAYLTGKTEDGIGRGELYNDDPKSGDARLCGTTASLCGIERALANHNQEQLKLAIQFHITLHAYMFCQNGIPILYSGDEIGQLNDYTYHQDPNKCQDSRYIHRGNFQWDLAEKRNEQGSMQNKIFTSILKLEEIRRNKDVFNPDAKTWTIDTYDDAVLGIGKWYAGEKLIALFNFMGTERTAWIDEHDGEYEDLFTGQKMEGRNVKIPPYGFWYLYKKYDLLDFLHE